MKRKLFTLSSAVSILLCLATVAMWVRSEIAPSTRHTSRRGWVLDEFVGGIAFQSLKDPTNRYLPLIDSDQNTPLSVVGRYLAAEHYFAWPGVNFYWGESVSGPPVRIIVIQNAVLVAGADLGGSAGVEGSEAA